MKVHVVNTHTNNVSGVLNVSRKVHSLSSVCDRSLILCLRLFIKDMIASTLTYSANINDSNLAKD